MSEQQLINYLLWMKERGQTVLAPSDAPSPLETPQNSVEESLVPAVRDTAPSIAIEPIPTATVPGHEMKVQVAESAPEPVPERTQYKVLFISSSSLNTAEYEMVSRIGAALKLDPAEFAIAAGEAAQKLFANSDAKALVLMGEDAYPLVQARIHQTLLIISHPGAMLSEPQLKITAWDALQKLKATL